MKSKRLAAMAELLVVCGVVGTAAYAALARPVIEFGECCVTVSCTIPGGTISGTECSPRECSTGEKCIRDGSCVNGKPANLSATCQRK